MTEITLLGTRLADPGSEFVYQGESAACEGCPYRDQCLNLTEGRRYRVTEVRDNANTLECAVHDVGVTAVEVEPAPIQANVAAQSAYAGSKVDLEGPCPHEECPSHALCEPAGADFETTYRIDSVVGEPPHDYCMLERDLTQVELAPPEE
ncbi:UPF0179 family protein [Halorhabdus sp. CBA1104]|uniref:UPF0179 family protein n=1 Tax=unclassified Halorhabdus TaxID=2621901 RepID=UPI0012B2C807|nr:MULTISPECIES: UPF0179 family protein [unclassified Halorhabdus]QGN06789.1 UPF0179 family protein [Halorhabdus sp. CBA1104]